jgi:hypothetical protein
VKKRIESLEIVVYKWLLLNGKLEAKSAVFELDVPTVIAKWRDITYTLFVDVFSLPTFDNS